MPSQGCTFETTAIETTMQSARASFTHRAPSTFCDREMGLGSPPLTSYAPTTYTDTGRHSIESPLNFVPYHDPFTTPYPARSPQCATYFTTDYSAASPSPGQQTTTLESSVEAARLANDALKLKRLAYDAAFHALTQRHAGRKVEEAAMKRAEEERRAAAAKELEEAAILQERLLLSKSLERWRRSYLLRGLHSWVALAEHRVRSQQAARAVIMTLRFRHVRQGLNSWQEATEIAMSAQQRVRLVITTLRARLARRGFNTWMEALGMQSRAHLQLQLALGEWRGDALRKYWRAWSSVAAAAADCARLLAKGSSVFRPEIRQLRQALNSWLEHCLERQRVRRFAGGLRHSKERRAFSSWLELAWEQRMRLQRRRRLELAALKPLRDYRRELRAFYHKHLA